MVGLGHPWKWISVHPWKFMVSWMAGDLAFWFWKKGIWAAREVLERGGKTDSTASQLGEKSLK